jgi:sulfur-oxidizing protein SoxX
MKYLIKLPSVPNLLVAAVIGVVSASVAAQGTTDELTKKLREKWTPGTPIPVELLTNFPCHSYELPCGNMPPRPIERPEFKEPLNGDPKRGEKIALDLRWGNCVACHELPGNAGGTIAPSLALYAAKKFPRAYTYQRIWDVRAINKDAHMPLYGTNRVLTDDEIRDVMAYLEQGQQK